MCVVGLGNKGLLGESAYSWGGQERICGRLACEWHSKIMGTGAPGGSVG